MEKGLSNLPAWYQKILSLTRPGVVMDEVSLLELIEEIYTVGYEDAHDDLRDLLRNAKIR